MVALLSAGSDDIVDYVEEHFPEPALGKHDAPPHVYVAIKLAQFRMLQAHG